MVFLKIGIDNLVEMIHYEPFDIKHGLGKTQEQLEQEGILVDSIPEPQQITGKVSTLHCNPTTKELWYEYTDMPKSQEEIQAEEIVELKSRLQSTEDALVFLMDMQTMGGM